MLEWLTPPSPFGRAAHQARFWLEWVSSTSDRAFSLRARMRSTRTQSSGAFLQTAQDCEFEIVIFCRCSLAAVVAYALVDSIGMAAVVRSFGAKRLAPQDDTSERLTALTHSPLCYHLTVAQHFSFVPTEPFQFLT